MSYLSVNEFLNYWQLVRSTIITTKLTHNRGATNYDIFITLLENGFFNGLSEEQYYNRYEWFYGTVLRECHIGLKILSALYSHGMNAHLRDKPPREWHFNLNQWQITERGMKFCNMSSNEKAVVVQERFDYTKGIRELSQRHQKINQMIMRK